MQRDTTSGRRVAVKGIVVAACALAALAGGPVVAAQSPDPEPLWEAYPLEEGGRAQATPTQASPPPTTTSPQPSALEAREESGSGPPWLLMALACAGGALFMATVLAIGRRIEAARARRAAATAPARAREARPPAAGPPREATAMGPDPAREATPTVPAREAPATGAAPAPAREASPAAPANGAAPAAPAFDVPETLSIPLRRFDRDEGLTPQQRAVAARRGPICQVRWDPQSSCFRAIARDEDGVEHEVARSLRFEWRDEGPPASDSRPAQSALRLLAKDLREQGWRPMRVKGTDHDAPRWYARRFRFPVAEGEDERVALPLQERRGA